MYIARILYPVEVLGPGKRIGIWFCGCYHHCKGCSNPELWDFQKRYQVSLPQVIKLINQIVDNHTVDGFTITGGDPFEQAEALKELIEKLSVISDDILIYTGYTLKELHEKQSFYIDSVLKKITVLIDGKYVESRNNGTVLRGSDNQVIHILNRRYKEKYENYLKTAKNQIQNFTASDGIISVGIHQPNFIKKFQGKVAQKGLKEGK